MNSTANNLFERHPDFIIGGAMKSGTSTVHQILARHPKIFLPQKEIAFFDLDDFDSHNDFFIHSRDTWSYINFEEQLSTLAEWYSSQFAGAEPDQLIGEDATGYLSSPMAAERIAKYLPDVKLIFILRNPTERTYSHYWHMLRTGREYYSFEDSLLITPETKLNRSRYLEHLKRYFELFPRQQIYVTSFEKFVRDKAQVTKEIVDFLGVDYEPLANGIDDSHANPAKLPHSVRLRRIENFIFRKHLTRIYANGCGPSATPPIVSDPNWQERPTTVLLKRAFRFINPQSVQKPPRMKPATRGFLNGYFRRQNDGLAELVGFDIDSQWYR